MNNEQRLINAVSEAIGIESGSVTDELTYNNIPEWDSIAHMVLVTALETEFDIMLDTDDIIDMSSVAKVKEILFKYGVNFV